MIKKIQCWKTTDGTIYDNLDNACSHEKCYQFKEFLKREIMDHTSIFSEEAINILALSHKEISNGLELINKSVKTDIKLSEKSR